MYEDIFELVTIAAQKKNLKESTAKAYCHALSPFLNATGKPWQALTVADADDYLTTKRRMGILPETYNHYYGALRFMYKRVLKLNWYEDEIPRMKRDRSLPTVLSREEVNAILDVTKNLKYKAIFAVMYSGGLRVSEATHLHYDDISRSNHSIHIRNTKNRMDRYTILADRTLDILTQYWFQCQRPRNILFPSQTTGEYLDISAVNQVLRRSSERAGIPKHVTSHAFRHSFASHLLEDGCDIKYIQALLGHLDPKSTKIYLHVSNKTLLGIKSPFDIQEDS